jgi:general secretion pathway protein J
MQHAKFMHLSSARQEGFTLLELLIASIIFAIMAMMAYGGLENVIDSSRSSEQALKRLQQVQQCVSVLNRDFSQIIQRGIRDEYGNNLPYLSAGNNVDSLIEFTRGGRVNPANLLRSSLLRVAYRFDDEKLVRLQWSQLDRAQNTEPKQTTLIENLETITMRFVDEKAEWHEQWPPLNTGSGSTPGTATIKPVAIEIVMQLKDWGDIRRLYAMN